MKVLFIHQNFPGQFKNLAPALAARGHQCVALTLRVEKPATWNGVQLLPYKIRRQQGGGTHPWLVDLDTKLIRAESCMLAAQELKTKGFEPDVIIAHPGWGESMFLRDVWPKARIGLFYELYYNAKDGDMGFDPEFQRKDSPFEAMRIRIKNLNNTLHHPLGDKGLSPTAFQASTFPEEYRKRISVIHDGINTVEACPDPSVQLKVNDDLTLTHDDEVITFVNRNLEPYRGYHVFMRALPEILKTRPKARVLIVGGDGHSYGSAAPEGQTWKQIYIDEVRGRIATPDWERVHFLGKIPYDQFLKLLQVTRVHIYLTYPFVLSWSLLEAMSCEAPILASDTAPVREVIFDDETGRLVDFFDKEGLVATLNELLDDPALRKRLGQNARKLVQEKYDLQTVCLPQQMQWVEDLYAMTAGGTEVFGAE